MDEVLGAVDRVDREGVLGRDVAVQRRRVGRGALLAEDERAGYAADSSRVRIASDSWSAIVTRSPGFFSITSPSASERNRGVMTSAATAFIRSSTCWVSTPPPFHTGAPPGHPVRPCAVPAHAELARGLAWANGRW